MKTVVVTGLIGSGKSAVCALLEQRGIPVYNADERTKALYDRRPSLVARLEKALGKPLRLPEGGLDRKALAAVIFSDAAAREKLEGIVYPLVMQDFLRWKARQKGDIPFVVLESAVLLSKPLFDGTYDAAVLVTASFRGLQWQETGKAVLARMEAQELPQDKVDAVLTNDGTPEALSLAVEQTFFDNNSYLCKIISK